MITLTKIEPKDLVDLITTFAQGNISDDACYELAYFLDDVFSEGLELDRLAKISKEAEEFNTIDDLALTYLNQNTIDQFKKEEAEGYDAWEVAAVEQIEEDEDCTILHFGSEGEHYLLIR